MALNELGQQSRVKSHRLNWMVSKLVTHIFGNYVLQKVINIVEPSLREDILDAIKQIQGKL